MADVGPVEESAPPPPSSGPPRSHLLLVALIGLGIVVVIVGTAALLLRDPATPDLAGRAGEAGLPSAPSDPGSGATERRRPPRRGPKGRPPEGRPPEGRPLDLGELDDQVAAIRELPLERVQSRALGERALADKISALAFEETDPKEVEADERLLIALRLAEPGIDLARTLEDLYREQVLGVYVPQERTLYVRANGRATPAQRMTTAHEITHALQDRAFDIKRLQKRYEKDSDAALAVLSLIEGDAVLTQQLWAQEHLTSEELQDAISDSGAAGSALDDAPDYLRASLFFPYSEGSTFIATLYRDGGFAAVDEAFRNPPTSSEQIIHPQRFTERDDPVVVKVDTKPGDGWKPSANYEFGEFDLRELLQELGTETAAAAAAGWDGGHIRSWTKGEQTSVAAILAFDSAEDADEACDAVQDWYAAVADGQNNGDGVVRGDRDVLAIACTADRVRLGLAPSAETAKVLAGPP